MGFCLNGVTKHSIQGLTGFLIAEQDVYNQLSCIVTLNVMPYIEKISGCFKITLETTFKGSVGYQLQELIYTLIKFTTPALTIII